MSQEETRNDILPEASVPAEGTVTAAEAASSAEIASSLPKKDTEEIIEATPDVATAEEPIPEEAPDEDVSETEDAAESIPEPIEEAAEPTDQLPAPIPEEVLLPDPFFADEKTEEVVLLRKQNAAVSYLRQQDCAMLTTLRDHLGENIRLHNILSDIRDEIARLRKLLTTPKPRFKIWIFLIGLLLAGGGAFLFRGEGKESFLYASIGVGSVLIILSIVLKVLANKKWQRFIDSTTEQLIEKEKEAEKAQEAIDHYWETQALPYISSIIPDRFPVAHVLDYNTVCGMLYVMDNLRADTVKEAINLYDELCFRANMTASFQNMEASLYETARNSARYAAAAERSAAANERAAASAALTAASAASMAASVERSSNASVEAAKAIKDSVSGS